MHNPKIIPNPPKNPHLLLASLNLRNGLLQRIQSLLDVTQLAIHDRHAHMTEAEVLGRALLVQATGKNDTLRQQLGQQLGLSHTLGQVNRGHAVSLGLGVGGELLHAHLLNLILDVAGNLLVLREALLNGDGEDLVERSVERMDELRRRGGKVRRLLGLVVAHDREPVREAGKVGSGAGLAGVEGLDGAAGEHENRETSGNTDGLLGSGEDDIEIPLIEPDLLASDGADAVDDDEGGGGDAADDGGDGLDIREDSGGGVDVRDGDGLVGLFLERRLDGLEARARSDGSFELRRLAAVGGNAVGE